MDSPSRSSNASGADRNAHAAPWTTWCHVCHDKRTAGIWLERSEALYSDWLADLNQQEAHELETDVRKFANIGNEDLTALDIAYFVSAEILAIEMDRRAQTGWT